MARTLCALITGDGTDGAGSDPGELQGEPLRLKTEHCQGERTGGVFRNLVWGRVKFNPQI